MLSHTNLANYYKTVFALTQHHKYQISEVENILPYERDLYVDLLLEYLEEQKQKQQG
jgi:hypothetical protein